MIIIQIIYININNINVVMQLWIEDRIFLRSSAVCCIVTSENENNECLPTHIKGPIYDIFEPLFQSVKKMGRPFSTT